MQIFIDLYHWILYQPLFNLLVLLYKYVPGHDFGVAVILLTIIIKFILWPLGKSAIKSQKAIAEIQPKMKEIQEKYKNNKEEQVKLMMELYKTNKINPFSGFLALIIQFPILIALYRVFWNGLKSDQGKFLYGFMHLSGAINPRFLGLVDLSKPNIWLAIIAAILQFFQVKMLTPKKSPSAAGKKSDFSDMMQKQMLYFLPLVTVLILFRLPSALGLYWVTTTLFSIIQQYFILKSKDQNPNAKSNPKFK